jgi:galactoside O-acetyltransferase
MAFLPREKLEAIGFCHLGKNVLLSDKASIYNPGDISIGDHARIDDFCILSAGKGGISLGRFVHIGCYSSLIGQGAIVLQDFAGLSGRVSIYSSSDDFSGHSMVHPTIPEEYRDVYVGDVILEKHVLVGSGSIILPGVRLRIGAAVGAMSFVKKDCEAFMIYAGCPARKIKPRETHLLELEEKIRETKF